MLLQWGATSPPAPAACATDGPSWTVLHEVLPIYTVDVFSHIHSNAGHCRMAPSSCLTRPVEVLHTMRRIVNLPASFTMAAALPAWLPTVRQRCRSPCDTVFRAMR